jgi:hypothetical protein
VAKTLERDHPVPVPVASPWPTGATPFLVHQVWNSRLVRSAPARVSAIGILVSKALGLGLQALGQLVEDVQDPMIPAPLLRRRGVDRGQGAPAGGESWAISGSGPWTRDGHSRRPLQPGLHVDPSTHR